nr:MAG TPA: hypothetical protein [Caudoviricetes sp.]
MEKFLNILIIASLLAPFIITDIILERENKRE